MQTFPRHKFSEIRSVRLPAVFTLAIGLLAAAAQAQAPRHEAGPPTGAPTLQSGYDSQPRGGDSQAGAPPAGISTTGQPRVPFVLSPQEQAQLDRLLQDWERKGKGVKTFECTFTRLEYDSAFGPKAAPGADPIPKTKSEGRLKYAAPDKGMFHVYEVLFFDLGKNKYEKVTTDYREKWICNGKSIFEFNPRTRELIERKLPPEMQGKAISDGPLPFLFGSDARALAARYFLRLVAPANQATDQYWIEALPRSQQDAANFRSATLILNSKDLAPVALSLLDPGGQNRTVYLLRDVVENSVFEKFMVDFSNPWTPVGWTKKVEQVPGQSARGPQGKPIPLNVGAPQLTADPNRGDQPHLDATGDAARPGVAPQR